jgi:hypothetical protein
LSLHKITLTLLLREEIIAT